MNALRLACATLTVAALAGCGGGDANNSSNISIAPEPVRPSADEIPEGTTPVAERTAVIGLLNKRNGSSRDLTLKPGQAVRVDNIIVRLRSCETTPQWEPEQLTGAFVQVDNVVGVNQVQRIFSGWLYKESPSLNVVEHPIYDVWVKSCEMTHPDSAAGSPETPSAASNASNASKSGAEPATPRPAARPKADTSAPSAATPPPAPRRPAGNESAPSRPSRASDNSSR